MFTNKLIKSFFIIAIFILSGSLGVTLSLRHFQTSQDNEIPTIQTFHSPMSFVSELKDDPEAGRKIFKEFCGSCHNANPVIDLNAPRINNKKFWQDIRKLNKTILLKRTIAGHGAMPARGGCFECSDAQLMQAIEYLVMERK